MRTHLYARLQRLPSAYHLEPDSYGYRRFLGQLFCEFVFHEAPAERLLSHPDNARFPFDSPSWNLRENFFIEDLSKYVLEVEGRTKQPTCDTHTLPSLITARTRQVSPRSRTLEHATYALYTTTKDAEQVLYHAGASLLEGASTFNLSLQRKPQRAGNQEYRDIYTALATARKGIVATR